MQHPAGCSTSAREQKPCLQGHHPGQQPFPGTGWHLRPAPHTLSGPVPSERPVPLLPALPLQLPILQAAQGPVSHPPPTPEDPDRKRWNGSPRCGRSAFRPPWGDQRLGHALPAWRPHWLRHNPAQRWAGQAACSHTVDFSDWWRGRGYISTRPVPRVGRNQTKVLARNSSS